MSRAALKGMRVLVTRARRQAPELSRALRQLGATVVEIPAIEIRPPRSFRRLDAALRHLRDYDWLILTSVNGVEALFARAAKLGIYPSVRSRKGHEFTRAASRGKEGRALAPASPFARMQVAAIGPATRAALERRELQVHVMPREYVAESVVAALREKVKGKRVLLVRARVARDVIPARLRQAGAVVDVVEAYQTIAPARSAPLLRRTLRDARSRPDIVTFTSSSTVRNLAQLAGGANTLQVLLEGVAAASIGPVTSRTLREVGLRPAVEARRYTIPGLVEAVVRWAKGKTLHHKGHKGTQKNTSVDFLCDPSCPLW